MAGARLRRPGLRTVVSLGLLLVLVPAVMSSPLPRLLAATPFDEPFFFTRVYIDGVRVPLPVPAVISGGIGMAPVRALYEKVGATVLWDGETGKVTIESPGKTIVLWLDRAEALVNGTPVELDAAPFIWLSTTMVPVRFVSETLGLDVTWDSQRWAVVLSDPSREPVPGEDGTVAPVAFDPPEITLAFAGDVLLASSIGRSIDARGPDHPWDGVRETLSSADIAMVNLESCVSLRGTPIEKQWVFRAKPEALAGLKNAGVDLVTTANNHVFDYGLDAFLDTLQYLEEYDVPQVGSGRNLEEALRPVIIDVRGIRVAFLAATQWFASAGVASATRPGVCVTHYHERRLVETIEGIKERDEADYIVVNLHWGIEGDHYTDPYQERLGRTLVDAGADIIIGHHPHLLQGIEIYGGGLIVYSLGNFVFTYTTRATMDSAIFMVTLDADGFVAAKLIPVYTAGGRPRLEEGENFHRIIREVEKFSANWGTLIDSSGYVKFP